MQTYDGAGYQPDFRVLAELAALDGAKWDGLVFDLADSGALTPHEASYLRRDVESFALNNGIDLSRGHSEFWLLEFFDPGAAQGEGFRGATIVVGSDPEDAEEIARRWDAHPGGVVVARQIPRRVLPGEEWRQRLLSAAELRELGDITNHHDA